jgi:murein L,D-transpeptidase YafK
LIIFHSPAGKNTFTLFILITVSGILWPAGSPAKDSFKHDQLEYPNVHKAFREKNTFLSMVFRLKDLPFPPREIYIRIFKHERTLELWCLSEKDHRYHLVRRYPICKASGYLGPKRRELDMQAPEGFYFINHFNHSSSFFLSLGINYPNSSDRILGDPKFPGGSIYIHGGCYSIGCFAVTDEFIKEIYVAALEARSNGQMEIPVHIFPCRLNKRNMKILRARYANYPDLTGFWENLKICFEHFEKTKRLPLIQVDEKGKYLFTKR